MENKSKILSLMAMASMMSVTPDVYEMKMSSPMPDDFRYKVNKPIKIRKGHSNYTAPKKRRKNKR